MTAKDSSKAVSVETADCDARARITELVRQNAELVAALRTATDDLAATYKALEDGRPVAVSIGQCRRLEAARAALASARTQEEVS